jgi:hypothetical protein
MLDFLISTSYLVLLIWSVIYIGFYGFVGLRDAVMVFEFSHFTIRGFSVRRLAFILTFFCVLLVPLHWWADWRGDEYVTGVSLLFTLITLPLCFFSPRTGGGRFLPFALGVIIFMLHSMLCKA